MTDTSLGGKRILLVVPVTQFREEEVFGPKQAFERSGGTVVVAAAEVRTCHGMQGEQIDAEIAISDVVEQDELTFDALILAGGSSVPSLFWKDKGLQTLAKKMAEAGKLVTASGLSTVVLARAGLLEGRKATVYYLPEALDELRNAGATYVSDPVVVEGHIITSEGPESAGALAAAITAALTAIPVGSAS